MQLYTPTFRNRKGGQKIFAAQTPQRKRGYVEDFALNSNFYVFIILTGVTALLLRYVRVTFGKIARRRSALLDNGFCTKSNIFGTSVIFYTLQQSTGLTFTTISLSRDDFAEF